MPRPARSITTTGGLLPSELLDTLANDPGSLPGTSPSDYHVASNRRLRDAINRSWADLNGAWAAFRADLDRLPTGERATSLTRERWLLPLLQELGFGWLPYVPGGLDADGKAYPISHSWGPVPIHLLGADVPLDRRTRGVTGAAAASPHSLVQDFLNRSPDHLWGLLSNGRVLRLLRDHTSLTRPAYVEFDLEAIFNGQSFTDFVVLWMLCHQSRFEGDPPESCWLERWADQARSLGVRALDALRDGFESAIARLGSGFLAHPANGRLRDALRTGSLHRQDYHRQVLRLVYRLVFLLVAEDRDLLHPPGADPCARSRYQAFYSLSRLRALAIRRSGPRHDDLYEALRPVFAALAGPGAPGLGLAGFGSFLWSASACPDLDPARLGNVDLLAALYNLAFTRREGTTYRVDFANLGAEELGGIYESLLELHPELNAAAATYRLTPAPGHERKTTGSYYTPTSLVSELLDSALDPLLDEAERGPDPAATLLELKVLDPACGSGHFLIAAAHRIALRLAAIRQDEIAPSPEAVRHALRDVIGHCIYGIDQNPMAVELAKVNLWLETMEPGLPLSFLDHHLAYGNALLGSTPELVSQPIPDDAYKPLTGDDKETAAAWKKVNAAEAKRARAGQGQIVLGTPIETLVISLAEQASAVDALPDTTAEEVEAKATAYAAYAASAQVAQARLSSDAWCAAFFLPKMPGGVRVTTSTVAALAQGAVAEPGLLDAVDEARARHGFLHWHVAFPDVYRHADGFSLVLGNPPWEKVKLTEKEFFAVRHPGIAAASGVTRKALIQALRETDPELWDEFQAKLRDSEAESMFLRTSGRYPLCGRGDVNTYAVFAEAMRDALAPAGRLGVIVQTGIATDDTTKAFFADCVNSQRLVSLYDFINAAPMFADVDRTVHFCLLTVSGSLSKTDGAEFAFFAHRPSDLRDVERRFTLSPADLELINPNTKTAPVFRSRRDAELTRKIYQRVPVLVRDGDSAGNPWGIEFTTMFHMTNDSGVFRTASNLAELGAELDGNVWRKGSDSWLPLYEAKMFHHFDHRFGSYETRGSDRGYRVLPDTPVASYLDPEYVVQPFYWVKADDVVERTSRQEWLFAFRDITRNDVERTFIGSVIPWAAVGNNAPLLYSSTRPELRAALSAVLASFVFDYVSRTKVGRTHLNFFIVEQLPVLPPAVFEQPAPWSGAATVAEWMSPRVLELTYTALDLSGFAADLGYEGPAFRWDPERRGHLRAELDAACFHLYGLDRDEVAYVMDTFRIVRENEEADHGVFRTKDLILDQYDVMAAAASTGSGRP